MKQWQYTGLCHLAIPVIGLKLWLRAKKQPEYGKRVSERFGRYSDQVLQSWQDNQSPTANIWLHTVSVGEFLAALPLIERLLDSGFNLLVTTTTPTGSEQVQKKLGARVAHVYAPYDIPRVIHLFLKAFKPQLFLIMETELWPNILAACRQNNIPSMLINGRLSERSARGYRRLGELSRSMVANLDRALMQHPNDAQRIKSLGMAEEKVTVCGNIKFDITLSKELQRKAELFKQTIPHRHVWIAASTYPGEEQIILDAHRQLKGMGFDCLLILVPRHPERVREVLSLCAGFKVITRSSNQIINGESDLLLIDTLGELNAFYGIADVAFVGGSLVERGGHNLVEPANWSIPVISGEHLFNFASMAEQMQAGGALKIINDGEELVQIVAHFFTNPAVAKAHGQRAFEFARSNQGALERIAEAVHKLVKKVVSPSK